MHLTAVVLILLVTRIAKGWECSAGCNTENGFCEKPGKCRCKPGWQGDNCDQCVPFPGCLHGTCEKAWQCICEEGWVGSLCDKDTRLCSSRPCAGNATCIETGEGGYLCICPHGYAGENCHLKRGVCLTNGYQHLRFYFNSPCQNGGTCTDTDGSAADSSCLCPPGFSGDFCEISVDSCKPNPCLNGGNCTNHGLAFTCICPHGFTGFTCNDTASLSPCAGRPCATGGTCVGQPDGTFRCVCQKWFTGPTCSQQHRPKARSKPVGARPVEHRVFALSPQHYSLPAHAFHKLLRPPERDLLKITLKETVHSPGVLVSHGQLICFGMLALLTCLVILGTTGIVFFGRCETWLANAKYSQLVRQQREHLLKEAGSASQEEPEHSVNIILPEKIRLTSFGRHYTSI
ncbi:protein delta homolog 1 isoform X1 [Thunnus albacares]|uniref:protein delta homolog 1 isoform X1 n=1 Tax=Thunnus albacares TaxID=8236 RepID=UPI001CF6E8B3|nr:protein delta homolog 1 isoform X1 [Thunnus albacares]XP_044231957.1 protein delta homolog 1 isoform X1 [Thunnus albacares]